MSPLIRVAQADDIEDVLSLWDLAEVHPGHTDTVASLQRLLRHDPEALLVADDGVVAAAERRLSDVGAVRIQATVVEQDAPAAGFWRASGWRERTVQRRFTRG